MDRAELLKPTPRIMSVPFLSLTLVNEDTSLEDLSYYHRHNATMSAVTMTNSKSGI
jgi:hypothetical protein